MKKLIHLTIPMLVLLAGLHPAAAQGTKFTYQGRFNDGGVPANGSYDLTFSLFNVSGGGGVLAGPVTNSPVAVSNGLFTTSIDFGAGVFNGTTYWLQIGARTNGGGAFTDLTPRQELTPTPYAIYAEASPIADNSVTSAKIVDGTIANADLANNSVNSAKIIDLSIVTADLADNSVTSPKIVDGTIANADLANDAVNSAKVLNGSLLGADLANNTVTSLQLADSIDFGDAAIGGVLNVYKTTAGGPAISLLGTGTGGLEYLYAADGSIGITLDGNSGGAGLISIRNTNGSSRVSLDGAGSGSGGQVSVYAQDGSLTVQLFGESSGAGLINVNNNVSSPRVVIDGEGTGAGGQISLYNATAGNGIILEGNGNAAGGQINLYTGDGGNGITLLGDSGGGGLEYLYAADGSLGISLHGDSGGGGFMALYNTNTATRVALDGFSSNGGGQISVYDSSTTETIELLGAISSTLGGKITVRQGDGSVGVEIISELGMADGGLVSVKNAAGAERIELDGDDGDGGAVIRLHNGAGSTTITLDAEVSGGGRIGIGRVAAVNALEVAGNASKDVAGSWLANSDRRIKEDVRPLNHALETINRVRPVGFRYTGEYLAQHPTIRNTEYFNVIAQEFAEVFPASVQEGGDKLSNGESVLQVDTYPATIYSIAAIQELDRKVKARDARVAELEKNVAELKSLLQTMLQKSNKGAQ